MVFPIAAYKGMMIGVCEACDSIFRYMSVWRADLLLSNECQYSGYWVAGETLLLTHGTEREYACGLALVGLTAQT